MKEDDLWDGQQYKENSSPQETSATEIINSIEFKGSEHVLDIGCGDGKITSKLRNLIPNGKIVGIDASNSMIAEAKKHATKDNHIFFFEKNAEDFHFDDKFDYIFSFHTLHWVQNKVSAFRNICNHLKPKGKFIFITSGRENVTIAKVFTSDKWRVHLNQHEPRFHSVDGNTIKSMLHEAGLSVECMKVGYWSTLYASKTDLINWLMTWVPYATGLDQEGSVAFSDEIAENMLIESMKNGINNGIEFKTEMLSIETYK
jgi:trans-aconitate methyltransferase